MSRLTNVAIVGIVLVLGFALLNIVLQGGKQGVTGYATIGDNTSAYCGYYINESTDLSGDIVGCSGYGLIVNASDIVIDCNGYWIIGSSLGTGVKVYDVDNVTVKNCNIANLQYGIDVSNSSNSSLFNNTILNSSVSGVSLSSGIYSANVSNNLINETNSGSGIVIDDIVNDSFFYGNTVINSSFDGIDLDTQVSNNTFINNAISNSKYEGLSLQTNVSHNNFINNSLFNNLKIGLTVSNADYNSFINNSIYNNGFNPSVDPGVNLYRAQYTNFTGNLVYNNSGYGLLVDQSNWTVLLGNSFYNNLLRGVRIVDQSYNNYIKNNYIYNNADYGLVIDTESNGTLIENVVYGNLGLSGIAINYNSSTPPSFLINNTVYGQLAIGIWIIALIGPPATFSGGLVNNVVRDSYVGVSFSNVLDFSNFSGNEVYNTTLGLGLQNSENNTLYGNSIYNSSVGAYVVDSSNNKLYGNYFSNNSVGVYMDSVSTNNNLSSNFMCWNGVIDIYNNLSFNYGRNNTCDSTYNFSDYERVNCTFYCSGDPAPMSPVCGAVLTTDSNLTGDLNCSGDALILNASGITLDCQGHWLIGNSIGNAVASAGFDNVVIKNCMLSNFSNGILLSNSTGSVMFNNRIYNMSAYGIGLDNLNNLNLTSNLVYDSGVAMHLHYGVNNSIFAGNNFTKSVNNVVTIFQDSYNNNFTGNIFSGSQTGEGLRVRLSNFTHLINNQFLNNFVNGVILEESENATLVNNTAGGNNQAGFYVSGSSYAYFVGNKAYNNGESGFSIWSNAISKPCLDLFFENNTAYSNSQKGLHLFGYSNGTFTQNLAYNNSGSSGFAFDVSYPSLIINNRAYSNTAGLSFFGIGGSNEKHILRNNTLNNNLYGLIFMSAHQNNVSNNRIFNNSLVGVYFLFSSQNNSFYGNWINNNGPGGVALDSGSLGNLIYSNFICGHSTYDLANNFTNSGGDNNTCNKVFNWSDNGTTGCTHRCPAVPIPAPAGGNKGGGGVSVNTPPYISRQTLAEQESGLPDGAKVDFVPTEKPAPQPVVPVVEQKPQPVVEQKKPFNWWPWLILLIIILAIMFLITKLRKHNGKNKH